MKDTIVFFDDICVLCSRTVRFIYNNDPHHRIYFASFNSEVFHQISHLLDGEKAGISTVVLYKNGKVSVRSAAALKISAMLRFPLPLLQVGYVIPPFIRDAIYDLISRKRFRWFGRMDSCYIPDPGMKQQFLG
ncbi:MAG: DCC1-like thiol-disulfide oxidoreductase family protein [Bacteroidales bacterium]|nr:DCC1-like thiol-disulfide oxidoreductase family protein [Bacteroidales bacterium]